MIGFLRFVGILNAAVWLGAVVFMAFGVEPAVFSQDTQGLLQRSSNYLSELLVLLIGTRCFYLSLACGAVALLHLLAEWLYLGRPARRASLALLAGLLALVLLNGGLVQPRLKTLHTARILGATAVERQAAQRTYHRWQTASQLADLLLIGGLAGYLWRLVNPPDTLRFVGSPFAVRR